MGWTTMRREPGTTDRDFFADYLGAGRTIVACATVRNVFYAAVREESGETWALVTLLRRTRGYYNFGYKSMTEESGPYSVDAPAAVLEALTPTENKYALEWRARVRARLEAKAARPKVKPGQTVRFAKPIPFSDGVERDTFTLIQRSTLRSKGGALVRIANWRERQYELVG